MKISSMLNADGDLSLISNQIIWCTESQHSLNKQIVKLSRLLSQVIFPPQKKAVFDLIVAAYINVL